MKKTSEKGILLVSIENLSYTSCQNGQFSFPSQGAMEIVCYL
jgi:hypothetical protein